MPLLIILFSASGCDPGSEPFLTYFVRAIKIHTVRPVWCKVLDNDNGSLDLLPRRNPSIYINMNASPTLICNNL